MGDGYILTPQEADDLINGRADAEGRGNPHPFNSPAWHVWNNGYRAAMSKWVAALTNIDGREARAHLDATWRDIDASADLASSIVMFVDRELSAMEGRA